MSELSDVEKYERRMVYEIADNLLDNLLSNTRSDIAISIFGDDIAAWFLERREELNDKRRKQSAWERI